LDEFVVMPIHVHGIAVLLEQSFTDNDVVGATHASPLRSHRRGPQPQSIASIIGSFKSATTKRINEYRGTPGAPVWQRNYCEHIIHTDESLERIRKYVIINPLQWAFDGENPAWANGLPQQP
jgi:REP element-mobilizing transposase RayT